MLMGGPLSLLPGSSSLGKSSCRDVYASHLHGFDVIVRWCLPFVVRGQGGVMFWYEIAAGDVSAAVRAFGNHT